MDFDQEAVTGGAAPGAIGLEQSPMLHTFEEVAQEINDKVKRKTESSDLATPLPQQQHSDRKPALVHRQPSVGNLSEQDCLSSFMNIATYFTSKFCHNSLLIIVFGFRF